MSGRLSSADAWQAAAPGVRMGLIDDRDTHIADTPTGRELTLDQFSVPPAHRE